jgi:hypothetical protein
MAEMIDSQSPATAEIIPGEKGSLTVRLHVPTYSGGATFELEAARDNDGDWRVYVPWPDKALSDEVVQIDGMDFANGIGYIGAPDVPVARTA